MAGDPQLRYMVIERHVDRRLARPVHRVTLFDSVEEVDIEVRELKRRTAAVAAEVVGVDSTGRLTTLWSMP